MVCRTVSGKPVKPKTHGQKTYVDMIRQKMIVFGLGPAGTGKTYLAMAMAIQAFKNNEVGRIILTRPAIEAGENLGFLPGDLQIITGDQTQKDLPPNAVSGLDTAIKVLGRVEDIAFVRLTNEDVVRHPLVQKIVKAYEEYENRQNKDKRLRK